MNFMSVGTLQNMESENKNYSENYKSADSGWQIYNIKMNIVT